MTATPGLPSPLVSTDWVAAHLQDPGLVIVDASWYLAAMQRDPKSEYREAHLPGAVFWDLDLLSDRHTDLPHMLPAPAELARAIGSVGIGNADRVVVYDGSGVNLSAPRVWWTLKIAGHDAVAVLDGGIGRWKREGRPLESGWVTPAPTAFEVRFRPELIRSLDAVRGGLGSSGTALLDARSRGRFEGSEPEPRPGLRSGHLPGSRNLPFNQLVGPDGRLLAPNELRRLYEEAGIDLTLPVVLTCGSGVTASALALGLDLLGHRSYAVYDGSWSEWGRPQGPPIEKGPPPAR